MQSLTSGLSEMCPSGASGALDSGCSLCDTVVRDGMSGSAK